MAEHSLLLGVLLILSCAHGLLGRRQQQSLLENTVNDGQCICGSLTLPHPTGGDKVTFFGGDGEKVRIKNVTLVQELSSGGRCAPGVGYVLGRFSIRVKDRCSAKFFVCHVFRQTVRLMPETAALEFPEDKIKCKRIRLRSRGNEPDRMKIEAEDGGDVVLVNVTLVRRLSGEDRPCRRGNQWGVNGVTVIAREGCKAVFNVCYVRSDDTLTTPAPEPNCKRVRVVSTVDESSREIIRDSNNRTVEILNATVVRQLSEVPCIRGNQWNLNAGTTIVTREGCGAIFRVCYFPKTTTNRPFTTPIPDNCRRVVARRPVRERIRGANGRFVVMVSMRLLREFSNGECESGENYFVNDRVYVVRGGCQGRFSVCFNERNSTDSPITSPVPPSCRRINIRSEEDNPVRTTIRDESGNEATDFTVSVIRRLDQTLVPCVRGNQWSVVGSELIVRKGCKARFEICLNQPSPQLDSFTTTEAAPNSDAQQEAIVTRDQDAEFDFSELPRCQEFTIVENTRAQVIGFDRLPAKIVTVVLLQETSVGKCEAFNTYSFEGTFYTVNGGCTGRFKICFEDKKPTPEPGFPRCRRVSIEEETNDREQNHSGGDPATIISLDVVRRTSDVQCFRNVSYFFEGTKYSVILGCRGVFRVCYLDPEPVPEALTSTAAPVPGQVCEEINVYSRINRPASKEVLYKGNPVLILSMTIAKRQSNFPCDQGQTYFFNDTHASAIDGCRASFRVCFFPVEPTAAVTTPGVPTLPEIPSIPQERVCPPVCKIFCPFGNKVDSNGCPICECKEGRNCREVVLLSEEKQTVKRVIKDNNGRPARVVRVDLLERMSNSPECQLGVNYFIIKTRLVVKNGCKGRFNVCFKPRRRRRRTTTTTTTTTSTIPTTLPTTVVENFVTEEPGCSLVTLFSDGDKVRQFMNEENGHVASMTIVEQFSFGNCILGETFFFSGLEVSATYGCRATFKVCQVPMPEITEELTITTTEEPLNFGPGCKQLVLTSFDNREDFQDIRDNDGNLVQITSMEVFEQISPTPCLEWNTFFFEVSRATAREGCKAVFKVCFQPLERPTPLTLEPGINK